MNCSGVKLVFGLIRRVGLAVLLIAVCAAVFAGTTKDAGVITLTLDDIRPPGAEQPGESQPQPQQPGPEAVGPAPAAPLSGKPVPTAAGTPQPRIQAASAALMDAETGQVVYSNNAHVRRPNASTTKIMTAILVIENCKMTEEVKADKKVCETPFTSMHLKAGEQVSVRDLLMALMVRSANDAAVAAAEHIAGSTARFAKLMNDKAREIGCKDTHFVNPNGLYDKNHYSSAYDLCLMARYAFRYPVFNEVVATRKHTLESRTLNRQDLAVFNKSKFLKEYPGADGVKSGYLKQAGYCYVGSATRDGWRLVSAVLKSDNAGRDTAALMDYAFNYFERVLVAPADKPCAEAEVTGGDRDRVTVIPVRDLKAVVAKSGAEVTTKIELVPVEAPISRGTRLGKLTACVNGTDVASVELWAADDVGISLARRAWPWVKNGGIAALCLLVGGRYGSALAKSSRRRRRGVAASLRGTDHLG